jgi:F-type H+-transporting ATPase subunit b
MPLVIGIHLLLISAVEASSGASHHEASISDLLFPVLNFGVLFIFLFLKFRKPLSEMFKKNAADIKSQFTHAMDKDKQAQIKLDMFQKKMNGLKSDVKRISNEAVTDGENYSSTKSKETVLAIQKSKTDATTKVKVERDVMIAGINSALVDEVINLTKAAILKDSDNQKKATSKLIKSL